MKITIRGVGALTPRGDWEGERFTPRQSEAEGQSQGLSLGEIEISNYPLAPKTYLDRASLLALCAASLALRDAGLEAPLGADCGLALGTRFGCVETMRAFEEKLSASGTRGASPLLFSHSYFNSPAALLAIEWGIAGHHAPFCGPDAAWRAVSAGRDAIALGHAKTMLCGGVEARSVARSWAGEACAAEAAFFVVLEREGNGAPFESLWREPSKIQGDWGALNGLLARWPGFQVDGNSSSSSAAARFL